MHAVFAADRTNLLDLVFVHHFGTSTASVIDGCLVEAGGPGRAGSGARLQVRQAVPIRSIQVLGLGLINLSMNGRWSARRAGNGI